jgi:hypothetical protein
MSAFGGKADMPYRSANPLMTQSGHQLLLTAIYALALMQLDTMLVRA